MKKLKIYEIITFLIINYISCKVKITKINKCSDSSNKFILTGTTTEHFVAETADVKLSSPSEVELKCPIKCFINFEKAEKLLGFPITYIEWGRRLDDYEVEIIFICTYELLLLLI